MFLLLRGSLGTGSPETHRKPLAAGVRARRDPPGLRRLPVDTGPPPVVATDGPRRTMGAAPRGIRVDGTGHDGSKGRQRLHTSAPGDVGPPGVFCFGLGRRGLAARRESDAMPEGVRTVLPGKPARGLRGRARAAALVWLLPLVLLPLLNDVPAAQEKPLRIGVLALGPLKQPALHCGPRDPGRPAPEARADATRFNVLGFRDELEKLGYREERPDNQGKPGRRFVLQVRQGGLDAVSRLAQELAQERVDLIFAISTTPVRAAQEATRMTPIPILFPNVSDPVRDGFAASFARPGGFLTGISTQLTQGAGKRVELFKEVLPALRRLLVIYEPKFRSGEISVAEMREAVAALRIALVERHAKNRAELEAALADLRRDTADGIIMAADPVSFANADLLLERSHERQVPVFGIVDSLADWGALAAYGPPDYKAGQRAAHYADKIFRGTFPGDLPIEPVDPVFVVNLKAAACFGLAVPATVLHQADRILR